MNETILIIEDNQDVRENTAELLELASYKIITASNGMEGLEQAKLNRPDLILCDIMMPELDGYGVLRALESIPEMVGTPFIFLTAKSEKSDFRTGMDMGADDYLTKPFNGSDLLRVVSARLKKGQQVKKKYTNNLDGLNDFMSESRSLQELTSLSDKRIIKKIRKKEMVFMEGDSPNFLYFVVKGKIKTSRSNDMGKEYITELYKDGDFFGYVALLDEKNHRESASALEDTELALIPKQDFSQLLFSNRDVSLSFIRFITNNLDEAEDRLLKLAYNSARKRVAEALLFLYRKYDAQKVNGTFPVLRENISAIAGIAPESVSRNLSDFKEEGLIEAENGSIRILDLKKLETLKN